MTTETKDNPLVALSDSMADAVDKAGAATVMVDARRRLPASGIVYGPDLILTADHILERDDDIQIVLPNGEGKPATIAGRDPGSDLAVLRVEGGGLTVAETVSHPPRVGQLALALGRPSPEGIQASLGVVSAAGGPLRTRRGNLLEHYLRTDTIPYPGFSGGPLINTAGNILGINTSGLTPGASLTIPVSLSWGIAAALAKSGRVRRGYLGIRSQPVPITEAQQAALVREQASGLLLVGVEEESPAGQGGLMIGDILVGLAGEPISDPDQLLTNLVGEIVGQDTPIEILRGGQPLSKTVRIGERK